MKQKVCIASILLLGTVCAKANNYKVSSPDGRLAVKVECVDGKAFYSVELNGKQMLKPSALGLVANYGDFSQHPVSYTHLDVYKRQVVGNSS